MRCSLPEMLLGEARNATSSSSVTGTYSGDADEFTRSLAGQPWLILAAVITIYIVLGVLYESFVHPFTILTTLPSAGIGALLGLGLTGNELSVIAIIGILLLIGIVQKNAIMIIDFAPHNLEFLREEHAHRRLGFADSEIAEWCEAGGVAKPQTITLAPKARDALTVKIWVGDKQ